MRRRTLRPDTGPLHLAGLDIELSRPQMDQLATHTDVVRFEAGETLARTGNVARQFLAVVDGELDVYERTGGHRTEGPGAHIGSEELLHYVPYEATIITRTECTVVVIFGPAFRAAARLAARSGAGR